MNGSPLLLHTDKVARLQAGRLLKRGDVLIHKCEFTCRMKSNFIFDIMHLNESGEKMDAFNCCSKNMHWLESSMLIICISHDVQVVLRCGFNMEDMWCVVLYLITLHHLLGSALIC